MENCVAPGLDKFDLLLEAVLSLVRVYNLINQGCLHLYQGQKQVYKN